MSIVKRTPVTVNKLASDLAAAAQDNREAVIAQAEHDYAAARDNVIEQGRQRAAELRRLEAEARAEAEQAEALVKSA